MDHGIVINGPNGMNHVLIIGTIHILSFIHIMGEGYFMIHLFIEISQDGVPMEKMETIK
jgi:hypothetical protein